MRLGAAGTRLVPVEPSSAEMLEDAEMVGVSDAFRYMQFRLEQVAPTPATVLLLGETGTGKGLAAQAIHAMSPRRATRFVSVDCAALPATLIESELFGHETGRLHRRRARPEIGRSNSPTAARSSSTRSASCRRAQAKLLRVLQEGEFERVGCAAHDQGRRAGHRGHQPRPRATRCAPGASARDLYYRLSVFPITMPPLRERHERHPACSSHAW